jgi:hypothetical protein
MAVVVAGLAVVVAALGIEAATVSQRSAMSQREHRDAESYPGLHDRCLSALPHELTIVRGVRGLARLSHAACRRGITSQLC